MGTDPTSGGLSRASFYSIKYLGVGANGVDSGISGGIGIVDTGNEKSALSQEMLDYFANKSMPCSSNADCIFNVQLDGFCLNIEKLAYCVSGVCTPERTRDDDAAPNTT